MRTLYTIMIRHFAAFLLIFAPNALISFSLSGCSHMCTCAREAQNPPAHTPPYPAAWWAPAPSEGAPKWEHLPQSAHYGQVILSKRNELGILSNFAATPFEYHGRRYASVEGFWQATKYPENAKDPRAKATYPFTRAQVEQMTAFDARHAGDAANDIMKTLNIDWVSFEGRRMTYKEEGESEFYKLIVEVMQAKLDQNPQIKPLLLQTGDLVLRPDHDPGPPELKAWQYFDIWMEFRAKLRAPVVTN